MLKELGPIVALGAAAEALWLATYAIGPLRDRPGPFLALLLGEMAICLWAYGRVRIRTTVSAVVLLGFAALFRITLLPAVPYQSEDVYRYLWDARLGAAGVSPYRFPPDAPELERFRDRRVFEPINSKPHVTAYPPVSQLLFRLATTLFGESVVGMKVVFASLEFLALVLAWRLALRWGCPLEGLALVAWNPLFVFEFSHSGHSDGGMLGFALLAFWLFERDRPLAGAVAYAATVLSKLHPALWLPLVIRRVGLAPAGVAVAAGAAATLLYFTPSSLGDYAYSLRLYYRLFAFNAGPHYLAVWVGRACLGESWDQRTGPYLLALLAGAALLIWLRFPVRDTRDLLHGCFWLMTVDLLLSATVHPWYLAWAALALPFFPYAFMVWWTGAALLSYVAYSYNPVHEPRWVLWVEYVPVLALMAWEVARGAPLLARRPAPEAP